MSFFDQVKPYFIENLHEELRGQLRPRFSFPLSKIDALALGHQNKAWRGNFPCPNPELIELVKYRIAESMNGKSCFIKVGAKAPTDSPDAVKNRGKAKNAQQAIYFLNTSEQKIPNEIHQAIHYNYDPWVHVFEWWNVPPASEFRVLVKGVDDEKLAVVGISQRNYLGNFPDIHKYHAGLLRGIAQYCHERILPYLPGECAVDVMTFITEDDQRLKLQLIDINPLIKSTDLCLFDPKYEIKESKEPNFDGTFRYIKDRKPVAVGVE